MLVSNRTGVFCRSTEVAWKKCEIRGAVLFLEAYNTFQTTWKDDVLNQWSGADTGGMHPLHPPTRPKEVLTWHLISLKIIAKNIFVLYIA